LESIKLRKLHAAFGKTGNNTEEARRRASFRDTDSRRLSSARRAENSIREREFEPKFHKRSYGYRPGKSAHDAIQGCKENSIQYSWVIDVDIKEFFDNISHEWMLKMVKHHTEERSMLLYLINN
jgi:hypothetical protein